ncbi:hypothetical protein [Paenibacillus sp. J5C2022]|uniref:hypothetical protein n=1 Tax=Paenibacillus sp. J5C2022 TaxID=2977129 RepID=UPI0021D20C92|nr:hypothetical protein [Paenibacillus sp. J5C2022]
MGSIRESEWRVQSQVMKLIYRESGTHMGGHERIVEQQTIVLAGRCAHIDITPVRAVHMTAVYAE